MKIELGFIKELSERGYAIRFQTQVRIHNNISRVRVGRGSNASQIAFQLLFQQRDQPTEGLTESRAREYRGKGKVTIYI